MNKWLHLSTLFTLVILLAACGGGEVTTAGTAIVAPAVAEAGEPVTLSQDYDDAAGLRNQLALGILRLEGTAQALSPGQASTLLPLFQTLKVLGTSSTSAPEETEAVQSQIVASLKEDQVAALAAMQLTNADLQAYYLEIGASVVKTPEPGVTPQSRALKDLPPEQREAARATAEALGTPVGVGRSGGASKSDVLLDNVIELLTERAGGS
jgi:hypothetical protein